MIEKMQFLSITGPKDDIDRAIEQHLSKYEFQLESTMTELRQLDLSRSLRSIRTARP